MARTIAIPPDIRAPDHRVTGTGIDISTVFIAARDRAAELGVDGEPYWRREPPGQATVEGCYAASKDDLLPLPELIERFADLGCDVVEMVLASQASRDRYVAAQWLNIRRRLDANPDDELAGSCARNSPPRTTRRSCSASIKPCKSNKFLTSERHLSPLALAAGGQAVIMGQTRQTSREAGGIERTFRPSRRETPPGNRA